MTATRGRDAAIVFLAAACAFLPELGATALWDEDEAFFAGAAAEMHRAGEWIVPQFNGELFAHKPPFMYWMMRLGFLRFGVNELGARCGSAVFGVLACLLVHQLGVHLFGRRAGLWAGCSLATSLMFGLLARAATADCYLVVFTTAALLVYVRAVFPRVGEPPEGQHDEPAIDTGPAGDSRGRPLARWLPRRTRDFVLMYALMGLAVLVKGPIGVLLPGAAIGLFILSQSPVAPLAPGAGPLRRGWRRLAPFVGAPALQTFWGLRPFLAIAVVLAVAGPWFAAVGWRTEGAFLGEFFGTHNFGRFLQPMENHRGPVVYYIPVMMIGCFPWSIFLLPMLEFAWRRVRPGLGGERSSDPRFTFVVWWACWMIGFFSLASTKLPNYVLPAYPALALLLGAWIDAWLSRREDTHPRWPAWGCRTLAAVGVLMIVVLPTLGWASPAGRPLLERLGLQPSLGPALGRLAWLGGAPLAAGLLAGGLVRRDRRRQALAVVAVGAVLFCVSVLAGAAGAINPFQTSPRLAAAALASGAAAGPSAVRLSSLSESGTIGLAVAAGELSAPLASFRHSPPSLVFYCGRTVKRLRTVEEASAFLRSAVDARLITSDAGLKQLRDDGMGDLEVLCELPRFPRDGQVYVVRRQVEPPSTHVAAGP